MLIKFIRVEKSSPELIHYKTFDEHTFDEDTFISMNVGKKFAKPTDQNFLKRKYFTMLPISTDKKKDLVKLCTDGIIPREYHYFYNNLVTIAKCRKKIILIAPI